MKIFSQFATSRAYSSYIKIYVISHIYLFYLDQIDVRNFYRVLNVQIVINNDQQKFLL